ncbi:MAG TPA: bifunctional DNA primase/polymerase [Methanocorpusculum sp.]|nr:bifunctional DNA primase/polymerase [Methanocorpusculum sp.]
MKDCNSQTLRDAAFTYTSWGYKILSLRPRSKEAESPGWNNPEYMDSPIHWESAGNENNNIGMPLKRNGFMVIDIDNRNEYARYMQAIEDTLVELSGVDTMFWESETIGISSGKPGSEKYLFRIPQGLENTIRTRKLNWVNSEKKSHSVVEFRCGDGFQDVMPPSIHPTGTKYQFVNGDYALEMPEDLLCLVCNMKLFIDTILSVNPDYEKPVQVRSSTGKPYEGDNYIEMWCDQQYLPSWLAKYGYTAVGHNRYLSPHSTTQSPGIVIFPDGKRFYSHGASDPFSDGRPHDAYDLLVYYEYDGDSSTAYRERVLEDLHVRRFQSMKRHPRWDEE